MKHMDLVLNWIHNQHLLSTMVSLKKLLFNPFSPKLAKNESTKAFSTILV